MNSFRRRSKTKVESIRKEGNEKKQTKQNKNTHNFPLHDHDVTLFKTKKKDLKKEKKMYSLYIHVRMFTAKHIHIYTHTHKIC